MFKKLTKKRTRKQVYELLKEARTCDNEGRLRRILSYFPYVFRISIFDSMMYSITATMDNGYELYNTDRWEIPSLKGMMLELVRYYKENDLI